MTDREAAEISRRLYAALEHEPRVNLHRDQIDVAFEDGVVTLSGEVADIAAKRLTLESAAALPGVAGIIDRLRTRPAQAMGDGEIADRLQRALLGESAFDELPLTRHVGGKSDAVRRAATGRYGWAIDFHIDGGVVTLDGEVPSLSHKRLAGILAWWVPGSRDVINGLGVEPPCEDSDAEILDALLLVLEKDRLIDSSRISAACEAAVITLHGAVATDAERRLAEFDAWALFGVDDVVNRIRIVP